MRIVVILGSYAPNYSAVGMCAKNIVDELIDLGHEVFVIAEDSTTPLPQDLRERVIRVSSRIHNLLLKPQKMYRTLYRAILFARSICQTYNVKWDMVDAYIEGIKQVSESGNIDLIVPFCFPFETIISAIEFKKNDCVNLKIAPIIFDNFVENPSLYRLKINKNLKRGWHIDLLLKSLNQCNTSFIIHSQKKFVKDTIPELLPKIKFIEHPLLVVPRRQISFNGHLLYTGSFLKGYVKSTNLANLLDKILPEINANIDFCIMGNDTSPIEKLSERYSNKISNHGRVPYDISLKYISESSILISVSEISGIQISSKIFNYISTGKPIIQFYYNDNDVNVRLLYRYPLAFFFKLKDDDIYEADKIKGLISFINNNLTSSLPFNEVIRLYPEANPHILAQQVADTNNDSLNG